MDADEGDSSPFVGVRRFAVAPVTDWRGDGRSDPLGDSSPPTVTDPYLLGVTSPPLSQGSHVGRSGGSSAWEYTSSRSGPWLLLSLTASRFCMVFVIFSCRSRRRSLQMSFIAICHSTAVETEPASDSVPFSEGSPLSFLCRCPPIIEDIIWKRDPVFAILAIDGRAPGSGMATGGGGGTGSWGTRHRPSSSKPRSRIWLRNLISCFSLMPEKFSFMSRMMR
mmetsp:Transcript_117840/g.334093  ORF Transcript_117840/g.334093 Transcript_117840/m.334093 type:complete len:222 (+) Transcript_117840:1176-1841(+)